MCRVRMIFVPGLQVILLTALLAGSLGCVTTDVGVSNPIPGLSKVAVVPFFNLSNEPAAEGRRFAEAYFTELQQTPGFQVLPVGVTEAAIVENRLNMNSPADALRLAEILNVDAVVVGAVTQYDPYYPPKVGLQVAWYSPYDWQYFPGIPTDPDARPPKFVWPTAVAGKLHDNLASAGTRFGQSHDVNAYDGSRWHQSAGHPSARYGQNHSSGQSAIGQRFGWNSRDSAQDGYEGADPRYPGLQCDTVGIYDPYTPQQSFEHIDPYAATPLEGPGQHIATQPDISEYFTTTDPARAPEVPAAPAPVVVAENHEDSEITQPADWPPAESPSSTTTQEAVSRPTDLQPSNSREIQQPPDWQPSHLPTDSQDSSLLIPQANDLPPLPPAPVRRPGLPADHDVPADDATSFRAPTPGFVLRGQSPGYGFGPPVRQFDPTQPLMSYTRVFDGSDAAVTAALRDYVELHDDLRSGGWEAYLRQSDDFIRFTAHLMVVDMLMLHGGQTRTRTVFHNRRYPFKRRHPW